jgi:hypothetical protein
MAALVTVSSSLHCGEVVTASGCTGHGIDNATNLVRQIVVVVGNPPTTHTRLLVNITLLQPTGHRITLMIEGWSR